MPSLELRDTKKNWEIDRFLYLLGDIVSRANPDTVGEGVKKMTYVSADCMIMFIHLMLMFIVKYETLELLMFDGQLCQTPTCLGSPSER